MRKGISHQFKKEYIVKNDAGVDIFYFTIYQYSEGFREHYSNLNINWDKYPILFYYLDILLKVEENRIDRLSTILFKEIKRCPEFESDYFRDEVLTRDGRYSPALAREVGRLKRKKFENDRYKFQLNTPYSNEFNPEGFKIAQSQLEPNGAGQDYVKAPIPKEEFEKLLINEKLQNAYIDVYSPNAEFILGKSPSDDAVFMYEGSLLLLMIILKSHL
jgi:hypothetical protein